MVAGIRGECWTEGSLAQQMRLSTIWGLISYLFMWNILPLFINQNLDIVPFHSMLGSFQNIISPCVSVLISHVFYDLYVDVLISRYIVPLLLNEFFLS